MVEVQYVEVQYVEVQYVEVQYVEVSYDATGRPARNTRISCVSSILG